MTTLIITVPWWALNFVTATAATVAVIGSAARRDWMFRAGTTILALNMAATLALDVLAGLWGAVIGVSSLWVVLASLLLVTARRRKHQID